MDFSIEMPQINLFGKSSDYRWKYTATVSKSQSIFKSFTHKYRDTDKTYVSNNDTFVPIDELL